MPEFNRESMSYRKGVNAFIIDGEGNFLMVQKNIYADDQWDVPGGGVEDSEDVESALLRELEEELGSQNFKILGKSSVVNKYEWPDKVISDYFNRRGKWYRGQEKFQYLVKYLGSKDDIKIQEEELKNIKWVPFNDLHKHMVFDGQWELAKRTLEAFDKDGILD